MTNYVFCQTQESDIKGTMSNPKITENCGSTWLVNLDCMSKFKELRTQNINNVIIGN